MIQQWNWRQLLPSWLGGKKLPKPVPQTFIEYLRANMESLHLMTSASDDNSVTYYRTGVGDTDFALTVKPAENNPKNTVLIILLTTSDKRTRAAQPLMQSYNRYLASNFPTDSDVWPKVELKN